MNSVAYANSNNQAHPASPKSLIKSFQNYSSGDYINNSDVFVFFLLLFWATVFYRLLLLLLLKSNLNGSNIIGINGNLFETWVVRTTEG